MNRFFEGYIEAIIFAETEEGESWQLADFAPETLQTAVNDCRQFCELAGAMIANNPYNAGFNFLLARNNHGAGFWDGDWVDGDKLTEISDTFGSVDFYMGDDGKIYN